MELQSLLIIIVQSKQRRNSVQRHSYSRGVAMVMTRQSTCIKSSCSTRATTVDMECGESWTNMDLPKKNLRKAL